MNNHTTYRIGYMLPGWVTPAYTSPSGSQEVSERYGTRLAELNPEGFVWIESASFGPIGPDPKTPLGEGNHGLLKVKVARGNTEVALVQIDTVVGPYTVRVPQSGFYRGEAVYTR